MDLATMLTEKTKKEIGGCYVMAVQKEELRLRRNSPRRVYQTEETAPQDEALEEPLEQDLVRVC